MSTSEILLSVDKDGALVTEQAPRAYMDVDYASPTDTTQTQRAFKTNNIIYTSNSVPLPYAIRSLNERKEVTDDFASGILPPATQPINSRGNFYVMEALPEAVGQLVHLFLEPALEEGQKDTIYATRFDDPAVKIYERTVQVGVERVTSKPWTIFQNRILLVKDSATDILNMSLEAGDPNSSDSQLVQLIAKDRCEYFDLTGININDPDGSLFSIIGIISFNNYVILWNRNRIFWSNPLDFTDFTPATGGAGQTQITDAQGIIVTIVPNAEGFTVYCRDNIIHATFTGDAENPWIFQEVVGAGGLITAGNKFLVSGGRNSGAHMAYTTKGLQQIQGTQAQTLPDRINTYISGSMLERKDAGNGELAQEKIKCHGGNSHSMLKSIYYNQGLLFMYCADTVPTVERIDYSQLLIYNTNTDQLTRIQYDVPLVVPRFDSTSPSGGVQGEVSQNLMPNQFYAMLRNRVVDQYEFALRVLDFSDTSMVFPLIENQTEYVARDADFQIGDSTLLFELGIKPGMEVEIHSIKLKGRNGTAVDGSDKAKVYVYSDVFGMQNPVEFIYHPDTNTYYGYCCGENPRIEVSGRMFLLSAVQVEISRGAK